MKQWIRHNKNGLFLVSIVVLIGVPIIVYLLSSIPLLPIGGNNDWAGFWGGYLGAIIGGSITLYVLFKTMQENRWSQSRQEKIDFCNYIAEMIGRICRQINERDIFVLKYLTNSVGGDKSDIYRAMLANNQASELMQTCSVNLISRIDNPLYKNVKELMDEVERMSIMASDINIGFTYTEDEIEMVYIKCESMRKFLGEMREHTIRFVSANIEA